MKDKLSKTDRDMLRYMREFKETNKIAIHRLNRRGPVEEYEGMVRVRVNVQHEITGEWVARVVGLGRDCVVASTPEEAVRKACEDVSTAPL